jgi:hypothetical protein
MRLFLTILVLTIQACGPVPANSSSESGPPPVVTGACLNGPTSISLNFFNENPRTSSGNLALPFNSNLITGYTVPGALSGLTGNCNLEDDRFSILSDTLFPSHLLNVNSSNQAFAPTSPEFQQLNSFYYAGKLKALMSSLGADLSTLGKVRLDAHCNYANNAFYSPSAKAVCLGYVDEGGGKKVWAADDADVVVHESGHSMNHTLASTSILNSSGEAGAVDEAIADYWAFTVQNNGQLAEWFLGALGASYIRDATQNHPYPSSVVYEIHADGRAIGEILWDLRSGANLGKATVDRLVKTTLELLPSTTRFSDFYQALYDASGPGFLNLSAAQRALIVTKFTNKGIHRADDATGLRLSTAGGAVKQIYIIDDHTISAQSGGNCNGQLDVGETALVLVNLENPNATELGMGVATLGTAPAGIIIPNGGQIGEFYRFNANGDFVSALSTGGPRTDAVIMAGFLIKATTAGVKNLSLSFAPMYADPTGGLAPKPSVSVNFSLTVGSVATSSSCSNAALWP